MAKRKHTACGVSIGAASRSQDFAFHECPGAHHDASNRAAAARHGKEIPR
jgi:hypothetical protein